MWYRRALLLVFFLMAASCKGSAPTTENHENTETPPVPSPGTSLSLLADLPPPDWAEEGGYSTFDLIERDLHEKKIDHKTYFIQKIAHLYAHPSLTPEYGTAASGKANETDFCGASFVEEAQSYVAWKDADPELKKLLETFLAEPTSAGEDTGGTKASRGSFCGTMTAYCTALPLPDLPRLDVPRETNDWVEIVAAVNRVNCCLQVLTEPPVQFLWYENEETQKVVEKTSSILLEDQILTKLTHFFQGTRPKPRNPNHPYRLYVMESRPKSITFTFTDGASYIVLSKERLKEAQKVEYLRDTLNIPNRPWIAGHLAHELGHALENAYNARGYQRDPLSEGLADFLADRGAPKSQKEFWHSANLINHPMTSLKSYVGRHGYPMGQLFRCLALLKGDTAVLDYINGVASGVDSFKTLEKFFREDWHRCNLANLNLKHNIESIPKYADHDPGGYPAYVLSQVTTTAPLPSWTGSPIVEISPDPLRPLSVHYIPLYGGAHWDNVLNFLKITGRWSGNGIRASAVFIKVNETDTEQYEVRQIVDLKEGVQEWIFGEVDTQPDIVLLAISNTAIEGGAAEAPLSIEGKLFHGPIGLEGSENCSHSETEEERKQNPGYTMSSRTTRSATATVEYELTETPSWALEYKTRKGEGLVRAGGMWDLKILSGSGSEAYNFSSSSNRAANYCPPVRAEETASYTIPYSLLTNGAGVGLSFNFFPMEASVEQTFSFILAPPESSSKKYKMVTRIRGVNCGFPFQEITDTIEMEDEEWASGVGTWQPQPIVHGSRLLAATEESRDGCTTRLSVSLPQPIETPIRTAEPRLIVPIKNSNEFHPPVIDGLKEGGT